MRELGLPSETDGVSMNMDHEGSRMQIMNQSTNE